MIKQFKAQEGLKKAFLQFNDKQRLIQYYISFDFPEKQMKMVNWWQKVIQFLIQNDQRIYITYQQLVNYVTIYNLKPTPLQTVINFLAKKEVFVPENQVSNKQLSKNQSNNQNKGWFGNLLPFFGKAQKQKPIFNFLPTERIYSKKIKQFKKQQIKSKLNQIFMDQVKCIQEFVLIKQLQSRCNIDHISIKQILKELQFERVILIERKDEKSFILYSNNQKDFESKQWKALQSMKCHLREQINRFQLLASKQQEKAMRLKEKAREQALNNNKVSAKVTLKELLEKQKKISNISTRKNLLQNQLTQLQFNQMNKSTIMLLQQSQKIYQQTIIDSSRLDDVMEKNAQMQHMTNQTNEKLEQMVNRDQTEQEVQQMFEKLNRQVQSQKLKKVEKKGAKVEITKEEPMDIEQKPKQQHFEMN